MKIITFFSNKGGVGQTTLIYHLAWMFSELGLKTMAADLDPQSNLTTMFLDDEQIEELWTDDSHQDTIYGAISTVQNGLGEFVKPSKIQITENLSLIPGDFCLSGFEDIFSEAWQKCFNEDEKSFGIMTVLYRLLKEAAKEDTEIVLIDIGPNLGAINKAALIATDFVCIPLATDLFSFEGLKNLGPALRKWKKSWNKMKESAPVNVKIPDGKIDQAGYIVMQHGIFNNRHIKSFKRWMNRIPMVYRQSVLNIKNTDQQDPYPDIENDEYCLSTLKHNRSLIILAMEARKPIFHLKPADGAIGAHSEVVKSCYDDFRKLALKIASATGISTETL